VPEGPKVPSYSETAKGLRDLLAAMLAAVAIGETAQGITLGRELLNSDIAVSLFRDLTMAILKSTTIPEREVENLIKTQRAAFDEWLEATVKDVRRVRDKYTADFSLFNFMTSGRRKAVVAACQRFDARVPQTDFEQIPITDDTEDGKRARHALRRKRAECHADKFINESEEVRNVKAAQYKRVNDDWDLLVEWNDYLDRVSNKEASDDIRRNDDSGGNAGNQGQDPSQGQEHHVG